MGRSPRRRTASQSHWSTASPRDGGRRCACSTPRCATSSPPRCSISISGAPRADERRPVAGRCRRTATDVGLHGVRGRVVGALDGAPCAARTGHRLGADRRPHAHRVRSRRADPRVTRLPAGATCGSFRFLERTCTVAVGRCRACASNWRVPSTSSTWQTPQLRVVTPICDGRGTSSPTTERDPEQTARVDGVVARPGCAGLLACTTASMGRAGCGADRR